MIRLLAAAEADLREVHEWYESHLRGLGETFVRALDTLLFRVERAPRSRPLLPGVAGRRGVRKALVRGFPRVLLYAVIDGDLVVVALSHTARRPGRLNRVARRVLDV